MFVSKKMFLTKGVGRSKEKLTSFELALRDAGIAHFNIVRVSSIFPPGCKIIPKKEGLKYLRAGEVVFTVLSENSTNEPHRLMAASTGIAIPSKPEQVRESFKAADFRLGAGELAKIDAFLEHPDG